jgi:hypothetical protein
VPPIGGAGLPFCWRVLHGLSRSSDRRGEVLLVGLQDAVDVEKSMKPFSGPIE